MSGSVGGYDTMLRSIAGVGQLRATVPLEGISVGSCALHSSVIVSLNSVSRP